MATFAIAADHAGVPLLEVAVAAVEGAGHEAAVVGRELVGPADDYPDFAEAVAEAIRSGRAERGIVLCGSGVGVSVAASKFPGIRAAVCHDAYTARQGVEHDDLNVLCVGARVIGSALARTVIDAFIAAGFSGEERHRRRLGKVEAFERRFGGER